MTKQSNTVVEKSVPNNSKGLLTADEISLVDSLTASIEKLDADGARLQKSLEDLVGSLKAVCLVGCNTITDLLADGSEKVQQVVNYDRYSAIRNLFMNKWVAIRKVSEKSAERAWNRYYADTGLKVPQSTSAEAIRKRLAKEKREAEMAKVLDIDKAIAEAMACFNLDSAKELIAEKKKRDKQANASKLSDLKPLADEVIAFVRVCADEKLLRDVKAMFVKSKTKALPKQ